MKRIAITAVCFSLLSALTMVSAQDKLSFSIQEAQEYALLNNKSVVNARMDIDLADLSIWETASSGLPQLNAEVSMTNNLKLMTQLLPGEVFGGAAGSYVEVQFGTKYNSSAGFTASQLLFNAPYLVGLQTVKVYKKLSEQGLEKAELDTREAVINTYYLILVTEEFIRITEGNIENLEKVKSNTEAMYSAGMAERTDVDQISTNVVNVETSLRSLERNLEISYNLFRFQLGLDMDKPVILTDHLYDILDNMMVDQVLAKNFLIDENVDFRMTETQMDLAEKAVKAEKATVLPSLSAFYTYTQSGMGNKLNDQQWFPSQMLGVQFSLPVFASGQRYTKIKKAEVELEKARLSQELVSDQLSMQEKQARYNLRSALEQFESQKENLAVSGRVYDNISLKYEQGIVSSLDLTQAHTNNLQAENNYIDSVLSLLQAKVALEKLLNDLQ